MGVPLILGALQPPSCTGGPHNPLDAPSVSVTTTPPPSSMGDTLSALPESHYPGPPLGPPSLHGAVMDAVSLGGAWGEWLSPFWGAGGSNTPPHPLPFQEVLPQNEGSPWPPPSPASHGSSIHSTQQPDKGQPPGLFCRREAGGETGGHPHLLLGVAPTRRGPVNGGSDEAPRAHVGGDLLQRLWGEQGHRGVRDGDRDIGVLGIGMGTQGSWGWRHWGFKDGDTGMARTGTLGCRGRGG